MRRAAAQVERGGAGAGGAARRQTGESASGSHGARGKGRTRLEGAEHPSVASGRLSLGGELYARNRDCAVDSLGPDAICQGEARPDAERQKLALHLI